MSGDDYRPARDYATFAADLGWLLALAGLAFCLWLGGARLVGGHW